MVGVAMSASTTAVAETAQYRVTFDATWSAETHPDDFPAANAHFSGLIGGTHNASVRFWEPGAMASEGIERMAEVGSKSPLDAEVGAAISAGTAFGVISGGGIGTSPGSVSVTFDMSDQFPLVSLVSMIAPSPDWFVGVHDFSLRADGQWLGRAVVDLWPYDSGTDHGASYASPNADANPQVPISQLSGFPFEGTPPLGTFTFVRLLAGDFDESGTLDATDIDTLSAAIRMGQTSSDFDVDGNSIVNGDDRTYWVDSLRGTYFGDANLDGRFDSEDLINVLSSGQYEDAAPGNSTWATGDWSGDGEFDSGDLVLALGAGGYESTAATAATHAVPEPHGPALMLLALAAIKVAVLRRK
jgi:hypothetical protein